MCRNSFQRLSNTVEPIFDDFEAPIHQIWLQIWYFQDLMLHLCDFSRRGGLELGPHNFF